MLYIILIKRIAVLVKLNQHKKHKMIGQIMGTFYDENDESEFVLKSQVSGYLVAGDFLEKAIYHIYKTGDIEIIMDSLEEAGAHFDISLPEGPVMIKKDYFNYALFLSKENAKKQKK